MELEAGLGIDSIKRMEIFGSLRERYPALQSVDVSFVGEVRTFQDIVALLNGAIGSDTAVEEVEKAQRTPARHVVSPRPAAEPGLRTPGLDGGVDLVVVPGDPA